MVFSHSYIPEYRHKLERHESLSALGDVGQLGAIAFPKSNHLHA